MAKHHASSTLVKVLRAACFAVWITVIVGCLTAFLLYPHAFAPERIAAFIEQFRGEIWAVYLLMSSVRGLTLLPSTPLVLAGTILFPEQPVAVLLVSMAGILLSSSMIYFFSELLGLSRYFEDHKPELTHKIKGRLDRPSGFLFVAAWAFFPFVPTDAVCYVAGSTQMNYLKFITAVFVGEIILCSAYIFLGGGLLDLLR